MLDSGIYQITNKINKKVYIGSSICIKNRWKSHLSDLRRNVHPNIYLQNSWNKHKEKNFEFSILEYTTKDELLDREQYWIDELNATNKKIGYNISLVAGSPMKNRKHTEKTIAKISETSKSWHTKNKNTVSYKNYLTKLSDSLKGHSVSQKTKNKISKANKGKLLGEKNPFYNQKHSQSTKILMSKMKSKLSSTQIKEIKLLINEGEKPQHIAETFKTQHSNILSIKNHDKYNWIEIECGFEISNETRDKLLTIKRNKEIQHKGFKNVDEIRRIKKLLYIGHKVSDIAHIFNTYDDKIRDIKKEGVFQWVLDYHDTDVTNDINNIHLRKFDFYLKVGSLSFKDIISIYKLKESGFSNKKIAAQFRVSEGAIGNILRNNIISSVIKTYME